MVNNDIFGGLKSALTRGYTLEEAMLSFFNAGYKRNEIEEAAKALQSVISIQPEIQLSPQPIWEPPKQKKAPIQIQPKLKTRIPVSQVQVQAPVISKPVQKPIEQKVIVKEKEPIVAPIKQAIVNRVSAYPNYDNSRIKTITVILVVLLAILLGILGLMYIFRSQIISFFNSIFSNA